MMFSSRALLALVPLLHLGHAAAAAAAVPYASNATTMRTYNNPILPGWHSDPSCVFVAEDGPYNNTAFCTTSSFMAFPGNPIYASRDLTTWKLASHSLNRVAQFPEVRNATNQQFAGMFANTLRYHKGTFYLISAWVNTAVGLPRFVLFTTTDPFNDAAWSDGIWVEMPGFTIDPDIFFDDEDGSVTMASSGNPIIACRLDVTTGKTGEPWALWNGTGAGGTEGPHIYRKDGWYYLLVAEGGTQLNHSATLARSKSLAPNATWEAAPGNPLVSNRGTNEYFQTVGHADLFRDGAGNWWGIALSTRGGPKLYNDLIFPMGRETVLYPVSWPAGEWPVAEQVRGTMKGPLPLISGPVSEGIGPVVGAADVVDFEPGSAIPNNWIYWRAPFNPDTFAVSVDGHPNTLLITAARANLTADATFNASHEGLSAVFRRQEHTYFNFSVDLHVGASIIGRAEGDELGVSNFLNQDQHVDIGIVNLAAANSTSLVPHFRVRANSVRYAPIPEPIIKPVPCAWLKSDDAVVRLRISPRNESHYEVFASQGDKGEAISLAVYTTALLSGDGAGTGGLLGVYATTNGATNHTFDAYFGRWRYEPVAQVIDYGVVVPVEGAGAGPA
ncbi:Xylosidase : arabinofuranosidase [Apiospora arundinis]